MQCSSSSNASIESLVCFLWLDGLPNKFDKDCISHVAMTCVLTKTGQLYHIKISNFSHVITVPSWFINAISYCLLSYPDFSNAVLLCWCIPFLDQGTLVSLEYRKEHQLDHHCKLHQQLQVKQLSQLLQHSRMSKNTCYEEKLLLFWQIRNYSDCRKDYQLTFHDT